MTDRFVGPGGDNGNSGLTWALRKLTLNGVEDTPVVAGDTVYVGPGIYRETLTVDVNGSSGNIITYIGDITGENTDSVGGLVRITGSDDDLDLPNERYVGIQIDTRTYRTFNQFYMDEFDDTWFTQDPSYIYIDGATSNIIIENCVFGNAGGTSAGDDHYVIYAEDVVITDVIVRNCICMPGVHALLHKHFGTDRNWTGVVFSNCIFVGNTDECLRVHDAYNVYARNCTFVDIYKAIRYIGNATGQDYVYDCLFFHNQTGVEEGVANSVTADYNIFTGVNIGNKEGANTIATSGVALDKHILKQGYKIPHDPLKLLPRHTDVFEPDQGIYSTDCYGLAKTGKSTRGAIQFYGAERNSDEYRTAPSCAEMVDASKHIITLPATSSAKCRVKVYVKREANYAGTNPQLVLKSPSVSNVTVTDTGSSGNWNKLQASITLGSNDKVLQIEVRSNNTATSGSYKVYVDDLSVKVTGADRPVMRWITNEMLFFSFDLDTVVDPWILPTIPIPGAAPTESLFHPLPSFFRS